MRCRMCGCENNRIICKLASNIKILSCSYPEVESHLVVCEKCGSVFSDASISQEEVTNYYRSSSAVSLSYYEVYGKEKTNKYFSKILSNIKKYITSDAFLLDIASGRGDFSFYLKKAGYKNIVAIDCNKKCIESLENKGIDSILSDTMNSIAQYREKFDLVFFIHSLEHYKDFDKAIISARNMLKSGGYIYIEVPDAESYCIDDDAPFTMFTFEHLVHFSVESFNNIANIFGFELVDSGKFYKANSYHVVYGILKKKSLFSKINKIDAIENAIRKYDQKSRKRLSFLVHEFEKNYEPLILWGIGASTALMLDGSFDKCNVKMLVDRNPARQGVQFIIGGKKILVVGPEKISSSDDTIVILPFWYKDSIRKQIMDIGLTNKIISLS